MSVDGVAIRAYSAEIPLYRQMYADEIYLAGKRLFPNGGGTPASAIVSLTLPAGTPDNTITAVANLSATTCVLSTANTYTDAAVKTAVDNAIAALQTKIDAAFNTVEQNILNAAKKINDDLAAERAYGVIAP